MKTDTPTTEKTLLPKYEDGSGHRIECELCVFCHKPLLDSFHFASDDGKQHWHTYCANRKGVAAMPNDRS